VINTVRTLHQFRGRRSFQAGRGQDACTRALS
jgi:hypothetical protein